MGTGTYQKMFTKRMKLYRVLFKGVTAGIEVSRDGLIVHAAPIFKKSAGLRFTKFREWVVRKGGEVHQVGSGNETGEIEWLMKTRAGRG